VAASLAGKITRLDEGVLNLRSAAVVDGALPSVLSRGVFRVLAG
jgi:hypothetical protein